MDSVVIDHMHVLLQINISLCLFHFVAVDAIQTRERWKYYRDMAAFWYGWSVLNKLAFFVYVCVCVCFAVVVVLLL